MKLTKKQKRFILGSMIGLGIGLLSSQLTHFLASDFFNGLENVSYDWRFVFKYKLEHKEDLQREDLIEGINIVDIDERSMAKLGNYHKWPRSHHGQVVRQLSQSGSSSIIFDIMFKKADFGQSQSEKIIALLNEADKDANFSQYHSQIKKGFNYDSMLIEDVSLADGIIGAALLNKKDAYPNASDWVELATEEWHQQISPHSTADFPEEVTRNIPSHPILDNIFKEFAHASDRIGLVNVVPDHDGVHRRIPLLYTFPEKEWEENLKQVHTYPVISIQAALFLMGKTLQEIEIIPGDFINLGKPFAVFQTEEGLKTSYPHFSSIMLRALHQNIPKILSIGPQNQQTVTVSYPVIYRKYKDQVVEVEVLEGQFFEPEWYNGFFEKKIPFEKARQLAREGKGDLDDFLIEISEDVSSWITITNLEMDEYLLLDPYTYNALVFHYPHSQISTLKEDQQYIQSSLMQFRWNKRRRQIMSPYLLFTSDVLKDLQATSWENLTTLSPGTRKEFGPEIQIPIDERGQMLINYRGPGGPNYTFRYISYYDVLANRLDPTDFQGKSFILGSSAPSLFDIVASPFEETYPGIEVHATALYNMLTNQFMKKFPSWINYLILISIGLIIGMSTQFLPLPWALLLTLGAGVFHAVISIYLFHQDIWVEIARPEITIFSTFLAVIIVRYLFEEKEKRFINDAFKNYISPELIDMMVESGSKPQLGGDESILTAFFTDIQGFSTFSEKLGSPTKLVELLNEYLSAMTDILMNERGTLDKYEGDAIIAFFGAPLKMKDHARAACLTAINMQYKLKDLRERWMSEGEKWPSIVHEMRMRIGINSGPIVTGNMGSHIRMNYTMMGDTVNLAARLESAAKQYGVYTMVSKEALDLAGEGFLVRELDKIKVVGKSQPVNIYEVLGFLHDATPQSKRCLEIYEKGLGLYRKQKWSEAMQLFQQAIILEPNHPDRNPGCKTTPSEVFTQRCYSLLTDRRVHVPKDWDGVFTASEK